MAETRNNQIRALVERGKTLQAIELALQTVEEFQLGEETRSEWSLIKSRLEELKKRDRLGIISHSEMTTSQNLITYSVLQMATQLQKELDKEQRLNRILFLAANPMDTPPLQLKEEYARLEEYFKRKDVKLGIVPEWSIAPDQLIHIILEHRPRIIHFSGHGIAGRNQLKPEGSRVLMEREERSGGGIVMCDASGRQKIVKPEAIEKLFKQFAEHFGLEVVVLNACHTATQAKAINKHVDYVIGMNAAIQDDDAIAFSSTFYAALARKDNVPMAFELALLQLELNDSSGSLIPELYIKE